MVLTDDRRYNRRTGRRVGDHEGSWWHTRIEPVTDAHREAARLERLRSWFRCLNANDLSAEQLTAMQAAYTAVTHGEAAKGDGA